MIILFNFIFLTMMLQSFAVQCMNTITLFYAIKISDGLLVEQLINNGADIEEQNDCWGRPIHYAALMGNSYIVQTLINAGANVNARNQYGKTALDRAGSDEIAQLLIDNGATINIVDDRRAFCKAINNQDAELIKKMIADGCDVNEPIPLWGRPLSRAASIGNISIIQLLLDNGAHINAHDQYGLTAMHHAGSDAVIEHLAKAGADLNIKTDYRTPPLDNTRADSKIRCLIGLGADVEEVVKNGNHNPIIYEAYIRSQLLRGEHAPDLSYADYIDEELVLITEHNITDFSLILWVNPAIINQQDLLGGTLLMYAATSGDYPIVRLLLELGADPRLKTKSGKNVFNLVLHILNTKSLTLEKKCSYEKIMQRCQNALCDHSMVLLQLACLKATSKKYSIPREILLNHIIALIVGSDAIKFTPSNPSFGNHPQILPDTHDRQVIPQEAPLAHSTKNISSFFSKKSVPLVVGGLAAACTLLYWYTQCQASDESTQDQQFSPNVTDSWQDTFSANDH